MKELDDWARRALLVRAKVDEADPIWGQPAQVYESFMGGWVVLGDRCGSFRSGPGLRESVAHWPDEAKARLTTWINDRNRSGDAFPVVDVNVLRTTFEGRPLRFAAKVDSFFAYLAGRRYRIGDAVIPPSPVETLETLAIKHELMRWTEATGDRELSGLLAALEAGGLITTDGGRMSVTSDGMLRMDQLDSLGAATDQAFVAMWFGAEMEEAYDLGIAPGLADAGYRAFRIDRKEHANKIDDEIIAEIRRSRFLVADFTCGTLPDGEGRVGVPRGGVYYEAGFAQGLNMPVIWTVREDQIALVHFDTRQFNHIVWSDPEDLRTKLYRRVAAVLGHYRAS